LFIRLTPKEAQRLRDQGFIFYDWGDNAARLVVSWDQPEREVMALGKAIAAL
jgi:threonine aldolase